MAGDSRTPHTDALDTLGTILGAGEERDAIHLAVEPMIAGQRLKPGQPVSVISPGIAGTISAITKPVGIVDPFLTAPVKPGERFYLVLYPGQVRSLRHVWEHPDFPLAGREAAIAEISAKAKSQAYIEELADRLGVDSDALISNATDYVRHGEYWSEGGRFEGECIPDEFWPHFTVVTGITPESKQSRQWSNFLSCSC